MEPLWGSLSHCQLSHGLHGSDSESMRPLSVQVVSAQAVGVCPDHAGLLLGLRQRWFGTGGYWRCLILLTPPAGSHLLLSVLWGELWAVPRMGRSSCWREWKGWGWRWEWRILLGHTGFWLHSSLLFPHLLLCMNRLWWHRQSFIFSFSILVAKLQKSSCNLTNDWACNRNPIIHVSVEVN